MHARGLSRITLYATLVDMAAGEQKVDAPLGLARHKLIAAAINVRHHALPLTLEVKRPLLVLNLRR
jgi:hypothetical protein